MVDTGNKALDALVDRLRSDTPNMVLGHQIMREAANTIAVLLAERDGFAERLQNEMKEYALAAGRADRDVKATEAATLERVAEYLDTHAVQSVAPNAEPTPIGDAGWKHVGMSYARAIRAKITPDATALDAVRADARRAGVVEGLREAAKIAGGMNNGETAKATKRAILARAEQIERGDG